MIVLLTDAMERATLAAARSLVARGHSVHVVTGRRRSLTGSSRGVREWLVTIDPLTDGDAWAGAVLKIGREVGAEGILPMTDHAMVALLPHQDCPGGPAILAPAREAWALASDKAALLPIAARAGFEVPATLRVEAPDDLPGQADLEAFVPGFLKPHRSVVTSDGRLRKLGVVPVPTPATCLSALRELPAAAYPVLLQRRVEGPGVGVFALRWDHAMVAVFGHRRIREVPLTGGVSVYRESIALDPDVLARTEALLAALEWQGVAMVECKRDVATGQLVIMEVNGRFWGSLQLALDAGVDFPALLLDCWNGRPVQPIASYRTGVRTRWEWGEMDYLWLRTRAAHSSGGGTIRAVTRGLGEIFHSSGNDHAEVFRFRDPGPFLVESARRLKLLR